MAGFLYETTTALCRLVYSGLLERMPTLKLVAAHLGGTVPFIAERMDRGFAVYPECRAKLQGKPSDYLKRIWMDTFPETPAAIRCALDFTGAGKILMGAAITRTRSAICRVVCAPFVIPEALPPASRPPHARRRPDATQWDY